MLDTTVKSGNRIFAPTWDMVIQHKNGVLTDAGYMEQFRKMMQASLKSNPTAWHDVAIMPKVALACYCYAGCFCHRYLLVYYFQSYCLHHKIPFRYLGEIQRDGSTTMVDMPFVPNETL
jgi:hypothetical protein